MVGWALYAQWAMVRKWIWVGSFFAPMGDLPKGRAQQVDFQVPRIGIVMVVTQLDWVRASWSMSMVMSVMVRQFTHRSLIMPIDPGDPIVEAASPCPSSSS